MTPEEELAEIARNAASGANNTTVTTEKQATGATQQATPAPPQVDYTDFWGRSEVNQPAQPVVNTTQPQAEQTAQPGTTAPAPGTAIAKPVANNVGQGKVSKQAIEAGAKTITATLNLSMLTICRPLLNWRFKKEAAKRFGDKYERGMELVMGDQQPDSPEEKSLKSRINRFLKERDKKIVAIPLTDEEEGDLEYSLKQYFEMKQVAMSPELMLYMSVGTILGKRVIDLAMWD